MEGTKTAVASLVTGLEFALARSFEVPAGRHRQDIKLRRLSARAFGFDPSCQHRPFAERHNLTAYDGPPALTKS